MLSLSWVLPKVPWLYWLPWSELKFLLYCICFWNSHWDLWSMGPPRQCCGFCQCSVFLSGMSCCAIVFDWVVNPIWIGARGKPSQGNCICRVPFGWVCFLATIALAWSKHTRPCVRQYCRHSMFVMLWQLSNSDTGLYVLVFCRLWWWGCNPVLVMLMCPGRAENLVGLGIWWWIVCWGAKEFRWLRNLYMFCLVDDKCVINKPQPDPWWVVIYLRLWFQSFP